MTFVQVSVLGVDEMLWMIVGSIYLLSISVYAAV